MEPDDSDHSSRPNQSWGQRHGLTIMMVVMATLFVLIIMIQVMS